MIAMPTSRTCCRNSSVEQLDAEARDRLELVERAARVPEPAAAHLPERARRTRRRSADRERRLVADAAGRVLVDDLASDRRARSIVSPLRIIASVSANVSAASAAEVDGHAERGHLVVGHVAARVAEDQLRELSAGSLSPSRLRRISSAAWITWNGQCSTIGWPGMPREGDFPPSQAFDGRPDVANSPRGIRPAAFFPST
jgi:hypothetical protein